MTDEERQLLRRRWVYTKKFKLLVNFMGNFEAFNVLDLRKEGIVVLENSDELEYQIVDRSLVIPSTIIPNNAARLRICELTTNNLTIAISIKKGMDGHNEFSDELLEMFYAQTDDN